MATENSISSNIPIEVAKGGTNATTMTTTYGVNYYDGTGLVTTAVGTATHVLTSNGVGVAPTFQAAGGGGGGLNNYYAVPTTSSVTVGTYQINGVQFVHAFGTNNTFIGSSSGNYTLSGADDNVGVGTNTLDALTSGDKNIAIGTDALGAVTSGLQNIAIGVETLAAITTTNSNVGIGRGALTACTGSSNIGIGNFSASSLTSGGPNIFMGSGGTSVTTGLNNVMIGSGTGSTSSFENTCVGYGALNGSGIKSENTAIGHACLAVVTTGTQNTCVGADSGIGITSASNNTAVGYDSLLNGSNNSAIGHTSLGACTGSNNVAAGMNSLAAITSVSNNTAIGYNAFATITGGEDNIGLGNGAGNSCTVNDSDNILIGNAGSAGLGNTTVIGTEGTGAGQQDTCFIHGIYNVTVGATNAPVLIDNAGQIGTVDPSSKRFKDNIVDVPEGYSGKIQDLRVTNFHYKKDNNKRLKIGLIAEEVVEVMPEYVNLDCEGLPHSVRYHDFVPILIKEIQRLNARISKLEGK